MKYISYLVSLWRNNSEHENNIWETKHNHVSFPVGYHVKTFTVEKYLHFDIKFHYDIVITKTFLKSNNQQEINWNKEFTIYN